MNIKITHNMLLDYLDTDATPVEIQDYVSLCGPNVETVTQVGDDYVYDIEVTSNRIDAASAFGFALECAAILPRYNKRATLKLNPLKEWTFNTIQDGGAEHVTIKLESDDLASRVSAVVLNNISVGPSPSFIQERLAACGISVINNVVDISNYIMISLGQPNHTFDFDKIGDKKMIIRKSKAGESITTLDNKEFKLPGDDIVIEDGEGSLIDLAGIMGGHNSSITNKTQNVLLCIETYNKTLLRKTSMTTGQRSMAVSYFEKGLDEERVESALVYGIQLLTRYAGGKVHSKIVDIYPNKNVGTSIMVSLPYIRTVTNTVLIASEIKNLLEPLGFNVVGDGDALNVQVPSYRAKDVQSAADIVEEVARIYGYHNIPSLLQIGETIDQPLDIQHIFDAQTTIREYLRALGFNEQCNYSMISGQLINTFKLHNSAHLHISNTISEEIEYMRTSLIPSLAHDVSINKGRESEFDFFECARTYTKVDGDLPIEEEKFAIVTTKEYSYLKGILENIFTLLKIKGVTFRPKANIGFLIDTASADIVVEGEVVGHIGIIQKNITTLLDMNVSIAAVEISLEKILKYAVQFTKYVEGPKFARIKRDVTYTSSPAHTYAHIVKKAHDISPNVLDIQVLSTFKNKVTLRLEFGYKDKNMTEAEAQSELEKITASLSDLN